MVKKTAYFSHAIRGRKGLNATAEEMDNNCAIATAVCNWIRQHIPELELYVPAEHEEFIQIAYLKKWLSEKQILEIDCEILERRDLLIVLEIDGWHGGGISVEIEHAEKRGIPIYYLSFTGKFKECSLDALSSILDLRKAVKKRFIKRKG